MQFLPPLTNPRRQAFVAPGASGEAGRRIPGARRQGATSLTDTAPPACGPAYYRVGVHFLPIQDPRISPPSPLVHESQLRVTDRDAAILR